MFCLGGIPYSRSKYQKKDTDRYKMRLLSVVAILLFSASHMTCVDWHLDEVYTKINGKMVYLWRTVDDEGTVLDVVVQRR